MRYVQINSVVHGSTGGVMRRIHQQQIEAGNDSYIFWGRGRQAENDHECNFGSQLNFFCDASLSVLGGKVGYHSKAATKKLLERLDEINPDVVHLHNIHGFYVNIEMLFAWLLAHDCHINWTLHDCWSFTGHCSHFDAIGCEQWKTKCEKCPQLWTYPHTLSGGSVPWNYQQKKQLFTSLPADRVSLITPSQWLADLVGESYMGKYPVEVQHNTINLDVFKPTPSSFKQEQGIADKFMILGVASPWTQKKGLQDFIQLHEMLDKDKFAIVLVGLSPKQRKSLPDGMIGLLRTSSADELAKIYTAADVFANPTWEENYPTTNLEAEACGTPVISYDTGGCRETLHLPQSRLVPTRDVEALAQTIQDARLQTSGEL